MRRRRFRRAPDPLAWMALVVAIGCGPATDSEDHTATVDVRLEEAERSQEALLQRLVDRDGLRVVDLTHPLSPESLYWPTGSPFEHRRLDWGANDEGRWYAAAAFSSPEHLGTHLDAPIHFAEDGWMTNEIPIERFVASAALIDISARCAEDPDTTLQPDDIRSWEASHGSLTRKSIVVVRTAWSSRWPDWERYYGSKTPKDPATLHFPGLSAEAAVLLATRGVAGVGIDTASLDPGPNTAFDAHRVLAEAGIFGLENLTNLEELPDAGGILVALPMKIEGGTGGPTRVVAFVPR